MNTPPYGQQDDSIDLNFPIPIIDISHQTSDTIIRDEYFKNFIKFLIEARQNLKLGNLTKEHSDIWKNKMKEIYKKVKRWEISVEEWVKMLSNLQEQFDWSVKKLQDETNYTLQMSINQFP